MTPNDDMNVIFVGRRHGQSKAVALNGGVLAGLIFLVLALILAAGWAGYQVAVTKAAAEQPTESELVAEWRSKLEQQKAQLARVREDVQQQVDALTLRLGQIQGRMLRLDALGQRFMESGLVASRSEERRVGKE